MTVTVSNKTKLARNPKVEEAPLQAEMMLFDPATVQFYVLNATMAFLWKNCDGSQTLAEIVDHAIDEFSDVDQADVHADFTHAATELRGLGLLIDTS